MSPITTGNFPKDLKGKRPMTPAKKAAAGVKKERFERMISGKGPARGAKPVKKAPGMGGIGRVVAAKRSRKAAMDKIMKGW